MKKITAQLLFFIFGIFFISTNSLAQMTITTNGIGWNSDSPLSPISINNDGASNRGISVTDVDASILTVGVYSRLAQPTTVGWKYSVNSVIESGFGNAVALTGTSFTANPATPNYNYAVYAQLKGENAGTAIFAWDRINYPDDSVLNTGGSWAGYFIGKTRFTQQIQIDAGGIKFPDGTVQTTANNSFQGEASNKRQQAIIDELLIEKEIQKTQLEKLAAEIAQQQEETKELRAMMQQLLAAQASASTPLNTQVIEVAEMPYLEQNFPNPSYGDTQINYYVPETTKKAKILLTGADGKVVYESFVATGKNQLTLKMNELASGTYFYSLVLDDVVTLSKQMVVR